VDFFFAPLAPVLALIKDGQLVPLAVSTPKRATALGQVPTTTEAGFVNSSFELWVGLFLPAKTPRDIVVKLHKETATALQAPAVRERLATLGVEPMPMSPEEFDKYFRDDVEATAGLVKVVNIHLQQ
jgi:tripartite-type tricarboxylate transporter receptor subunit TctC